MDMSAMLLLVILIVIYLLPTLVACGAKHRNAGAIFMLNVLLGWTLLGWVIALVWACMATQHAAPAR